jgi:hypothetical protein
MQTLFIFNQTSYRNEEVNRTYPFLSVGVPWIKIRLHERHAPRFRRAKTRQYLARLFERRIG